MEFFRFSKESGTKINKFNSNFVMSRIVKTENPAHIGCVYLETEGVIGYHQAILPQLLLVVNGEAEVCGEDKVKHKIKAGEAVFWIKGEYHETTAKGDLTAIIIESESLEPVSLMKLNENIQGDF
ncbi:cupin [Fictibacillus phosphorivorans]|uniref:Cupin n=1 Tax=Fictibacillus phosphorivorans TaxID=1221500 RepID=A0A160IJL6_9BACL|nr:cupin [Fictibacillus phosphorivorans]ANC76288.1 cupin [Fictibacillus phosphorivorans]